MSSSSTGPDARTITIPESERGMALPIADAVAGLLRRDTGALRRLQATRPTFTVGSAPDADIRVTGRFISRHHCIIERDGGQLRVRDANSHNGTFVNGARIESVVLSTGSSIVLAGQAGACMTAISRLMIAGLPAIRTILGYDAHEAVHDFVATAMRDDGVVVLAEQGSLVTRLIDVLHKLSARRAMRCHVLGELPRPIEAQRALIDECRDGTIALVVDKTSPGVDEVARALLFDRQRNLRIVVAAPTMEMVVRVLGADAFARMDVVTVPPFAPRSEEWARILDDCLEQVGSPLGTADLLPSNTAALDAYPWRNLEEIWQAASWINAIAETGSVRKAAAALGIPRSTLQGWITRLGLSMPLLAQ